MEPFIAKNTSFAATRMADEAAQQGYTDTFKWFTFMATDVIGESSFGQSFEMLRTGKKDQYIHDLETVGSKGTLRAEFPFLIKSLAKLPFGPAKEIYAIVQRMNRYAEDSIQRYHRQLAADPEDVKPTLLTKEYGLVETGELPWEQLRRDAVSFIGMDSIRVYAMLETNSRQLLGPTPLHSRRPMPSGYSHITQSSSESSFKKSRSCPQTSKTRICNRSTCCNTSSARHSDYGDRWHNLCLV